MKQVSTLRSAGHPAMTLQASPGGHAAAGVDRRRRRAPGDGWTLKHSPSADDDDVSELD